MMSSCSTFTHFWQCNPKSFSISGYFWSIPHIIINSLWNCQHDLMNSMRTAPQPVVLWGYLQTVKNVLYYTVTLDTSVLKITHSEPVSHNSVPGKSFLTWMAKELSSCVAVKKSSLAVSITFFKFFNFFYFGRSDLSLSATFHWPFSRDPERLNSIHNLHVGKGHWHISNGLFSGWSLPLVSMIVCNDERVFVSWGYAHTS